MRTFVIEFQVTVVTKSDEMASGEIKKKTQLQMDEMRQERKKRKKCTTHWLYLQALFTLKSNLIIVIYYSKQSIIMNINSENFFDYVKKMQLENIEIIYNMLYSCTRCQLTGTYLLFNGRKG